MEPSSEVSPHAWPSPPYTRTFAGVLGGLAGLVALSVVAGLLLVAPLAPAIAISGRAASTAASLFDGMPSYLEIDRLMLPTTIYARDPESGRDVELTSFYDQNRVPVRFDEVAPVMHDAILASEDPRFYRHGGIDIIGTTRALIRNAQGDAVQGGSSISQQYVKNVLVQRCERDAVATETQSRHEVLQACWLDATRATGVEGYQRKLQEIRYAVQVEQEYSKNDILMGYLNIANFGGTTYGIEAAARYYFSTTAAQLTLGQAATLAGIVQNPNRFRIDRPTGSITDADGRTYNKAADSTVDDVTAGTLAGLDSLLADGVITQDLYLAAGDAYSATKGRQLYVLDRMREDGRITTEQYVAAAVEPIVPAVQPALTGCAGTSAPFFCQYVVNTVRSDPDYASAFGETPQERQQSLTREGLNIYTTLDWRLQNASQDAMRRYAPETVAGMNFGAASVSVEATTGRILAISQNNRFTEDADLAATDPAYTSLVYAGDAVHGVSEGFPTGSTFKLFTLIDWLEKGRSLYQPVNGSLRVIPRLQDRCEGPWINLESHVVRNFGDVRGYTGTPMQFTAQSLNSGFLGMAEQLDLCDIENVAARMGVTRGSGEPVDIDGAAAIIGTNNVAPVALAAAYADGREQRRLLRAASDRACGQCRRCGASRSRRPVLSGHRPRGGGRDGVRAAGRHAPRRHRIGRQPERRHADDRQDGHARTDPDVAGRVEHPSDDRGVGGQRDRSGRHVPGLAQRQTTVDNPPPDGPRHPGHRQPALPGWSFPRASRRAGATPRRPTAVARTSRPADWRPAAGRRSGRSWPRLW